MSSEKKTRSHLTVVIRGTSSYWTTFPKQIAKASGFHPGISLEWLIASSDELRVLKTEKTKKSNVTVIQEGTSSDFIIIPKAIAGAFGIHPGDSLRWRIVRRDELLLTVLKETS